MAELCVLGVGGMLGSDLRELLRQNQREFSAVGRPELDICDHAALAEATAGARLIVNCAAYTHVDGAEQKPAVARAVNAEAVGELGRLAAARDQYVLHISTDFVFDGEKDAPYSEDDAPAPINVYGASKWQGEQALAASGCRHAIIRVEWTYGRHGRHFVSKILELLREREQIRVVDDQVGAPTPTTAVARALLELVDKQAEGTYLYASRGYASRYEVARFIAEQVSAECRVEPCGSDAFPLPARRPRNSRFDCGRIDNLLRIPRPEWRHALTDYLKETP